MLVYFFTKVVQVARTVGWGGEAIQAMPESKTFFQGGRPLQDGTKLKEEDGTSASAPGNQTYVLTSLACPTR